MPLTVLSVGYALAPVGPDAVGGAEQILSALDRALVVAGHRSIVVAPAGSEVAGTLVPSPPVPPAITDYQRRAVSAQHRRAVETALGRWPIDLIHAHGLDFATQLPATSVPTLVTLHLPASFYPPGGVSDGRAATWYNCVSRSQASTFPSLASTLDPIENGVPVERLTARHARRNFALALGRICPEKGFHLALDAAAMASNPMLLAGKVFPYEAHRRYFEDEIRPRLGAGARFLGSIGFARKTRLLSAARCLLAPSLVAETSSLVAMEAIACGTPVVAFPAGALTEIVEPGVTGFLVDNTEEMAEAIAACAAIDRNRCRAVARERFSIRRMLERYLAVYSRLARPAHTAAE
jgi:glycosyltransferase involved in cell wall biosynthesis